MPNRFFRPQWLSWRTALLSGPLLLLIWMSATSYDNLRVNSMRVSREDRMFQLLNISHQLFGELETAESGKRGYLLTGKESYLEPYRRIAGSMDGTFHDLIPLAELIPDGPKRLESLRILTTTKLAEMRMTIDLYESKGVPAALEVLEADATQHHMDQIRSELSALISDINAGPKTIRDATVKTTARTNLIVTLGAASLFLLLTFATALIERDRQKQDRDALQIQELNQTLEHRVDDRTRELKDANRELEAFCYSVSHDLRSPLRSVDGFAKILVRDYTGKPLDARANDLMNRMSTSVVRMGQLIDDLLNLSRVGTGGLVPAGVDLSSLGATVAVELTIQNPGRHVEILIQPGLSTHGDPRLLRVAIENLFGNAWKFTRNQEHPRLEFGESITNGAHCFFVRDNGVGFDMAHAQQLFVPFQRLHSESQFEGTGIGLATVQRVIHCHGGRIWADSTPGCGATFYFTIQPERKEFIAESKTDLDGGGQPRRRAASA